MERNINIDDFEDFLKEKVDQYKMYPSDKVWNNIHRSVHPLKKWPYITLTLLLLLGTAIFVDTHNLVPVNRKITLGKNSADKTIPVIAASRLHKPETESNTLAEGMSTQVVQIPSIPAHSASERLLSGLTTGNRKTGNQSTYISDGESIELPESPALVIWEGNGEANTTFISKKEELLEETKEKKKILWGGEPFKKSKINWQLYFAPVVSYRRLSSDNREVTNVFRGVPYMITQESTSVNNLVTHKPAIGAEVGANMVYRLADNFSLKAGLQLNYSRYQLRAYATKPEQATLAVDRRSMIGDSINVISTLKNFSGNGSSWFNNEFFQLALPVGFEWGVLGNSTLKWNVAASVQPVYNFANNIYLLSTDFQRYGQDPSLVRKWNINAGAETFVTYNMGSFKWQAGPQLRYQLMSSYSNKYPVKEYLVDFGFKIGVTKTIR